MTPIKLITVCSHPEHAETLRRSAELHGWDLSILQCEWRGFGSKLIETYQYLIDHPEIERFVFADAFDVVVFGSPEEFERKLPECQFLASAERGLWPSTLEMFRNQYTSFEHGFNYINSGLYYAGRNKFTFLMEKYAPQYETDDQEYLNSLYLGGEDILIDHEQKLFNSHSFIREDDYKYNGRVEVLGNHSVFVHSNAKTVDPNLDELVGSMLG